MKSENLEKIQNAIDENKEHIRRSSIPVPFTIRPLDPFRVVMQFSPGSLEGDEVPRLIAREERANFLIDVCALKEMEEIPQMRGAIMKWTNALPAWKAEFWLQNEDELTQSLINHLNTIWRDYELPSWKPSVRR